MYVCMYVPTCVHVSSLCLGEYTYKSMHVNVCMCLCVGVCGYMCAYIYMCVYVSAHVCWDLYKCLGV